MAELEARRVTKEEEKWVTVTLVDLMKIADETNQVKTHAKTHKEHIVL